jgi:hypothetical protein
MLHRGAVAPPPEHNRPSFTFGFGPLFSMAILSPFLCGDFAATTGPASTPANRAESGALGSLAPAAARVASL